MSEDLSFSHLERVRAPRQERSRRAFAAALDAFDDLLREQPLHGVTMEQVAARAGLSITSVYGRFDGKAALVLALHERAIARALARLDEALAESALEEAPLEELAAWLIERVVSFADDHGHVFRAVLAAADDETNQRAAAFVRAGSERVARLLVPRLQDAEADIEQTIDFAWRSLIAVLQQRWFLWGAEPSRFPLGPEAFVRRLTRSFLSNIASA